MYELANILALWLPPQLDASELTFPEPWIAIQKEGLQRQLPQLSRLCGAYLIHARVITPLACTQHPFSPQQSWLCEHNLAAGLWDATD